QRVPVTAGGHGVQPDRLAAADAIDRRAKVVRVADLLSLNFRDHIAFTERIAGGGDFLYAGHDYAANVVVDAVHLPRLRRELLHRHAETVARRLNVVVAVLQLVLRGQRALGRGGSQRFALPVANDGDGHLRAHRHVRDVVDEIAVGADALSVDR